MAAGLFWLYFSFAGRAGRQAYALAGLLLYLARMYPVYRITVATTQEEATYWGGILVVIGAVTLAMHVPLAAKRFQDFGKPGWLALFSIVADFFLFLVLCFIPGNAGPNRYAERSDARV